MKKRNAFYILLFITFAIAGQELSRIIPPSPTATSLGQFADIPVSNYTGVPNISIPLYTVNSGEINLPITLNYHASGIKVAQEASWVGLGWSLNAGGVITRQIRGIDDFKDGIITTGLPPSLENNYPDITDMTYYTWYDEIKRGYKDSEPDVFYYNFFGYSGKLVFEQQSGNPVRGISIDQNNLIFSYDKTTKQWNVTDGNGWKYFLGNKNLNAVEETTSYSFSDTFPIDQDDIFSDGTSKTAISAWYLTEINTPSGDKIEFSYINKEDPNDYVIYKSKGQVNYYELLYNVLDFQTIKATGGGFISPTLPGSHGLYSASQQVVSDIYLDKITFRNGSIEFQKEDRLDIRPYISTSIKPQRLKSTTLFDTSGKEIKKIDFTYSYFDNTRWNSTNPENNLRLRLDTVKEEYKPPYVFSYNTSVDLPEKNSYSIDHWGYYNGKNNESVRVYSYFNEESGSLTIEERPPTRISKMLAPNYGYLDKNIHLSGADREVNPNKVQAAILERIQYPTGGVANFSYESNDYFDSSNQAYTTNSIYLDAADTNDFGNELNEILFTLNDYTIVYLYFSIVHLTEAIPQGPFTAVLEHEDGTDIVSVRYPNFNNNYFDAFQSVMLPPGRYRLKTDNGDDYDMYVNVTARYTEYTPTSNHIGPGLRIKSIQTIDEQKTVKQKNFSYNNLGVSTGRMVSPLKSFYNETLIENLNIVNRGNIVNYVYAASYLVRSSSSSVPFGNSANGSPIGYNEVIVSETDKGNKNLGTTKYFYKNEEEIPVELFMPGVPNIVDNGNGQLLAEKSYNDLGVLLKEKRIEYELDSASTVNLKGVKIYSYFGNSTPGKIRFYDVYSEWWSKSKETETVYDFNGANPLTTITDYEYNDAVHKNVSKVITTNSKSGTVVSTLQYPSDYPTGTGIPTSVFDSMVYQNLLNPVIKQETKINNELTSTRVSTYKNWDLDDDGSVDDIFLPEYVKTSKGSEVLENKIAYHNYDSNGRPQEVSKEGGASIYYIWGYQGEHPIAKIENFTAAEANTIHSSLIAPAILASNNDIDATSEQLLLDSLDAIRTDRALENAQMTYFTYDPLIGVTSITDPRGQTTYYHYDEFNRLEAVTDANGNLLSENEYNYKQ